MKRIIIYLSFTIVCVCCYGQNIRPVASVTKSSQNIRKNIENTNPECRNTESIVKGTTTLHNHIPDTVYSISTIKKHGWVMPLGIISKEQSKHRNTTVMFTGKNKHGHWTKVETIDSYGKFSKGIATPYILKNGEFDAAANKDWLERLKESCIIEFISDPTGKNVIQERAYDEHHNIIFVFSRTPIDSIGEKFIGAYKDFYGLPAEMRETPNYTYGTIVRISEDKWGHDHIIEYLDSKGVNKLNGDSVYQSVCTYDKDGHKLTFGSQNDKGEYVIDLWGNCGVINMWNKDHTLASAMYADMNWKPMRMPSIKSNEKTGVIKVVYDYDEFKRSTLEKFVDENDNPMTNIYGTHKIVSKYDTKGNVTEYSSYDLEDKLSPIINNITAKMVFEYDSLGREIQAFFYDKNNKPVESIDLLSKRITKYDDLGEKIFIEEYKSLNSVESVSYSMQKDSDSICTIFTDKTSQVDILDKKGRTIKNSCYDENHQLYVPDKWAMETINYIEDKDKTIRTEITYNEKLNEIEVDGISKTITIIDSLNNSLCQYRYNRYNELKETFGHLYDKEFKWVLSEYDMNRFGNICRSGGTAGVLHYIADVVYNQRKEFATLVGRDEYKEPDYITSDNDYTYYYQKLRAKGKTIYYDENNNPISDFNSLRDSLPKVLSIEVIDSVAYRLGLKDNDVILRYGTYINDLGKYSRDYERMNWAMCAILAASNEKQILVYRIDDTKNNGCLVKINLPKGTVSQLGFLTHMRYLTTKQANRITGVLNDYNIDNKDLDRWNLNSFTENMANLAGKKEMNLVYPELYRRNRNEPYPYYVTDVGFLLGYYICSTGESWICDGTTTMIDSLLNSREGTNKYSPHIVYYFTTDMKNVKILNSYKIYISGNWSSNRLSDKNFEKINVLSKIIKNDIAQRIKDKQNKKIKKTMNDAIQIIRNDYSNNYNKISNNFKGVKHIEMYNFEGDYASRDNVYKIIESISNSKEEKYTIGDPNDYGSICLMSINKANRINKCVIYSSKSLIYAEGEFSQVQLNKMSNLLK